jgi:hypothetical protein
MNRIINHYGATNTSSPVTIAVDSLVDSIAWAINDIVKTNNLTPEEIICLGHKASFAVNATIAERLILAGINMRKAEREMDIATQNIVDVAKRKTERTVVVGPSMAQQRLREAREGLRTETIPAKRQTPAKWCKELGVTVLDPDGWDRTDPNCMDYPLSISEFVHKYQASTTCVHDRALYAKHKHLFETA